MKYFFYKFVNKCKFKTDPKNIIDIVNFILIYEGNSDESKIQILKIESTQ